jgi:hypothetical protein
MKIGFTGTRNGTTAPQYATLSALLAAYCQGGGVTFHHGCCKGADAEAAALLRRIGKDKVHIVAHPGATAGGGDSLWLAEHVLKDADEGRGTLTHFARNRNIVAECEILIACPAEMKERQNGGTWYTIRRARKEGRQTIIIWPTGAITRELNDGQG